VDPDQFVVNKELSPSGMGHWVKVGADISSAETERERERETGKGGDRGGGRQGERERGRESNRVGRSGKEREGG